MFERQFSVLEFLTGDHSEEDVAAFRQEMDKLTQNGGMMAKELGAIIRKVHFSDVLAHLLKEMMDAVDKAGSSKSKEWSREEVIDLIAALQGGGSIGKGSAKSQRTRFSA